MVAPVNISTEDSPATDLEGEILNDFLTKLFTSDVSLTEDFKTIINDYLDQCSTDGPILD